MKSRKTVFLIDSIIEEMGLRTCIFFCGLLTSIAFGSLLASGILDTMEGKLGHAAWR